ncbi:MAG: alpha-amylase family glycosyl hydrolase [Clostridium sp.]|nr:alpha-amylase family glycosyl hydrolase [Clostridium sp.]
MIRFTKKLICLMSVATVVSSTVIVPVSSADASVLDSQISQLDLSHYNSMLLPNVDSKVEKAQGPTDNGLAQSVGDGCILHAWNWYFSSIKNSMKEIADAGFTAVQTSPFQPNKDGKFGDTAGWWKYYQPYSFSASGNNLGSPEEFRAMCEEAHKYGVKVIVDVVANHLANNTGKMFNQKADRNGNIPAEIRDNDAFWHNNDLTESSDGNRYVMTNAPIGMPDLNTGNEDLQKIIFKYLNDVQNLGADGFRFDAAKHIELPEDQGYFKSNFWPNLVSATKAVNKDVFLYGEILNTPGPISIDYYTKRIRVTNNKYGQTLRNCVTGRNASGLCNMSNNEFGKDAKTWITWVESHDTFAGEYGEHTSGFSTDDIHFSWYALAARADAVPLYFARPKVFQGSNQRGAGFAGSALGEDDGQWKDKGVAEVNKFHNYFAGTGEYASSMAGNKVFAVERGSTGTSNFEGIVLVNLDRGAKDISESCHMKDGTYTDQMTGSNFTVSGGKISGKIGDSGVAVVYNVKSSTAPAVSASVANGSSFTTDSLKVTLNSKNCTKATYSINGGKAETFNDGDTIEIGKDADYGDKITLKLSGTGSEGDAEETYTYTKKDPSAANIAYLKLPSGWDNAYAYVYDKSTKGSENATWPGVKMTKVSDGLYKYEYTSTDDSYVTPLIIFNNGASGSANIKYPADTVQGVDADGVKCEGSMICDGTSWKEYEDITKKKLEASLTSDKDSVEEKEKVKLTAKATGGSKKYTYTFKVDGKEIYSGKKSTFEWTPEKEGTYKLTVEANDGTDTKESEALSIKVTKAATDPEDPKEELEVSLTSDEKNIKLDSSVTFKAKATGGLKKYTYTFKADGKEIYSGKKSTFEWKPEKEGTYKVTVEVNDGEDTVESNELSISVTKDSPEVEDLKVSLSANKSAEQKVNTKIKFTAKATGGQGDYTYKFKVNDEEIDNSDNSIYTWKPKTVGKYTISVIVSDGENTAESNIETFNIIDEGEIEEPTDELNITSFKVNKTSNLKVSDKITISAKAEGGQGDLKYYFFAKKDGKNMAISGYSDKNSVDFELPSEGTYDIYVYVKDSDGIVVKIDEPIEIKVSGENTDEPDSPSSGDNNGLIAFLLTGILGTSLLGLSKKKKGNN